MEIITEMIMLFKEEELLSDNNLNNEIVYIIYQYYIIEIINEISKEIKNVNYRTFIY